VVVHATKPLASGILTVKSFPVELEGGCASGRSGRKHPGLTTVTLLIVFSAHLEPMIRKCGN
jgi:hypothetical protein